MAVAAIYFHDYLLTLADEESSAPLCGPSSSSFATLWNVKYAWYGGKHGVRRKLCLVAFIDGETLFGLFLAVRVSPPHTMAFLSFLSRSTDQLPADDIPVLGVSCECGVRSLLNKWDRPSPTSPQRVMV